MDHHREAVQKISAQVRNFYHHRQTYRINHGSTNSTRPRDEGHVLDISHLSRVLLIDTNQCIAHVEPNVPMDRLVEATLDHGLVPPVVMEFPGITVGGGYAGTSGESSSFKHGYFNETMVAVEMVLADGEVVRCSAEENADLFHGAAGALGTLGIVTLVELKLQPAKKFVVTRFHAVDRIDAALQCITALKSDENCDYIDGIMFSKTHGAIVSGHMTDVLEENVPIQTYSQSWDPWFYLHVQDAIRNQAYGTVSKPIAIPLAEYLFRYDRGGFWVGRAAFRFAKTPFNASTRWFLDDFCHTRMMYTALHASNESQNFIVQDLALPWQNAPEFFEYCDREHQIYPVWLCPLRKWTQTQHTFHPQCPAKVSKTINDLPEMINFGLWGYSQGSSSPEQANRSIEKKLLQLHGRKWLYAHVYYTPADFWSIYDRGVYDSLRRKYRAVYPSSTADVSSASPSDQISSTSTTISPSTSTTSEDNPALPSVYSKVHIDLTRLAEREAALPYWIRICRRIWPLNVVYGIVCAIRSRQYLLARTARWRWRGRTRGEEKEKKKAKKKKEKEKEKEKGKEKGKEKEKRRRRRRTGEVKGGGVKKAGHQKRRIITGYDLERSNMSATHASERWTTDGPVSI